MSTVPNVIPETNVGVVPHATPDPDVIELYTCGSHAFKSLGVNEWHEAAPQYPFPWVFGGRPQLYAALNEYQYWEPISIEMKFMNFQMTSDMGPNATDHQGLSKNAQIIFYKDDDQLFGPLPEPIQKTQAFTDWLCNERHMHNGYDKQGILYTGEGIKFPDQDGYLQISETCGEVTYVPCNTDAEYTYSHHFKPLREKRLCAEWYMQTMPDEKNKKKSPGYFRADTVGCKIVKPFSTLFNGFFGRHTINRNDMPYFLPNSIKCPTWADWNKAALYPDKTIISHEQNHDLKMRTFNIKSCLDTFAHEFATYEMYKGLCNSPDQSEHNPMPALFYKPKMLPGAQGNMVDQTCIMDFEYKFTMRLSGRVKQSSISKWPKKYTADQTYSGNYVVPKQPYTVPVFYYVKDSKDSEERLFPNINDYQNMLAGATYPFKDYAPSGFCEPLPPTTSAPITTKKP